MFGYLLDLFGSFGKKVVLLGIFWIFLDLLGMWCYFWVSFGSFGYVVVFLGICWIFLDLLVVIFGNLLDLFGFFGYVVVFLGIITIKSNVCRGSFGSFGLLWFSPNLIWNNICLSMIELDPRSRVRSNIPMTSLTCVSSNSH